MIYLDFNATTPVDAAVFETMVPWFTSAFENPASSHAPGRRANRAVTEAREAVAQLLGCEPSALVFTSGSTEANNLAIKGLLSPHTATRCRRLVVTAAEHKSVLETAGSLPPDTLVDVVPVDHLGRIDLDALRSILAHGPALVSVLAANNEVGTLNPIGEVANLVHSTDSLLHTDATQWVGKVPVDVGDWDVDLLSLSSHKVYGPKGVGALYVRRGLQLQPQLHGGGQERGLRGGTLNVPGIVGFGAAAKLAGEVLETERVRMKILRDRLLQSLQAEISNVVVNGDLNDGLPNTLNVRFVGAEADAVLAGLPDVSAATGSACTSAVPTPSHVLLAMGLDSVAADECVRLSLGRTTTTSEIDRAVQLLAGSVDRVRALSEVRTFHEEKVR